MYLSLNILNNQKTSLTTIGEWLMEFTPFVGIDKGLILDISGMKRLHKSLHALGVKIETFLVQKGLSAKIGIAPTVVAAQSLASGSNKSIVVIECRESIPEQVGFLPISALLFTNDLNLQFNLFGIKTIADLIKIPREALLNRFPISVINKIEELLGERPTPLKYLSLTKLFYEELYFEDELYSVNQLSKVITKLTLKIKGNLRKSGLAARHFIAFLKGRDMKCTFLPFTLQANHPDSNKVSNIITTLIERVRPDFSVTSINVRAYDTYTFRPFQLALTRNNKSVSPEERLTLIDLLIARLGSGRVQRLTLQDSHIPEILSSYTSVLSEVQRNKKVKINHLQKPNFLLHSPVKVSKCSKGISGFKFQWRGGEYEIQRKDLNYPENVSIPWWNLLNKTHTSLLHIATNTRSYFCAKPCTITKGGHLWIYRESLSKEWFVHGYF
jgi:protein ImuB